MSFDLYGTLLNSLFLSVLVVCLGMIFGNLKCLGMMKFGVGGPLFAGTFIGWGVYKLAQWIYSVGLTGTGFWAKLITPANLKTVKDIGTFNKDGVLTGIKVIPSPLYNFVLVLFVAAVGLLASKNLLLVLKKYGARFVLLAIVIATTGAVLTYSTIYTNKDMDIHQAAGLYTGSLTSSPSLSAAIEKAEQSTETETQKMNIPEEKATEMINNAAAGVNSGYAIAYPFAMMIIILSMGFLPKIFGINLQDELDAYNKEVEELKKSSNEREVKPVVFEVKSFMLVCLVGYILGQIHIKLGSFGQFNLGSTGGVLISAIVFGCIGKIGSLTFRMDDKVLGSIRNLTLACYIGMMGTNYGKEVIEAFLGKGLYFVIAALIISSISILVGFLVGKYVFKINYLMLSGAICGGMTSTPGLGRAIEAAGSDAPSAGYAAAYPFGLITKVLFIILMYNLPH